MTQAGDCRSVCGIRVVVVLAQRANFAIQKRHHQIAFLRIRRDGMISINEAVHVNIDKSREIYDWVWRLCTRLGAADGDLVPFEKYAKAAEGLAKPSSAARALFGGAEHIERVDCLVRQIARQQGLQSDTLDEIVTLVDERLAKNRTLNSPKRS